MKHSIFTSAGLCLAEQCAKHLWGFSQQNTVEKGRDRERCNSPTEKARGHALSLSLSLSLGCCSHCTAALSTVFCLAKPQWNHKAEQPVGNLSTLSLTSRHHDFIGASLQLFFTLRLCTLTFNFPILESQFFET